MQLYGPLMGTLAIIGSGFWIEPRLKRKTIKIKTEKIS